MCCEGGTKGRQCGQLCVTGVNPFTEDGTVTEQTGNWDGEERRTRRCTRDVEDILVRARCEAGPKRSGCIREQPVAISRNLCRDGRQSGRKAEGAILANEWVPSSLDLRARQGRPSKNTSSCLNCPRQPGTIPTSHCTASETLEQAQLRGQERSGQKPDVVGNPPGKWQAWSSAPRSSINPDLVWPLAPQQAWSRDRASAGVRSKESGPKRPRHG